MWFIFQGQSELLWENYAALGLQSIRETVKPGSAEMAREVQNLYQDFGTNQIVAILGNKDRNVIVLLTFF